MLEQFFKENPSVLLGFSGGADSSYLLYAGCKCNAKIKACYVKTEFQPEFELSDAYRLAKQVGAEVNVLELGVLDKEHIASNPPERCYHCKTAIFGALCQKAREENIPVVIDGTNASDDANDRLGTKALSELRVRSPLRECGITKSEVRRLSKEAGLFTWDKPAYACLATRIPVGHPIDGELLKRVEEAENALSALGFVDFRVRVMGEAARLQFPSGQIDEAARKKADLVKAVKPHFRAVLLDLEGR
ncbi:MAG: ATP-dependent sacrificial sulfur transferase LarE [Oscillospiraceae bacterium]|jgi:uncharacterized protein|nr:ATP-dependent sacrificial sulfur transferase LarE [Oscillospiraceae bacterium]